ncbi:aquaporin [Alsobacter sp. SYSU BS001988]|jgi:aquaporin Z
MKRYLAEGLGTAALVLIGCGAVAVSGLGTVLSSGVPSGPLAILPIAIAFGFTVTAMAYGIGPISGCHINPAVTAAVWSAGRMTGGDALRYVAAQVIGAVLGAGLLVVILMGRKGGYDVGQAGLGQNGWGADWNVFSAFVSEVVATFLFTVVILGATSKAGATPVAGLAIGVTLLVLHLPFVAITGLSVNPARSFGPALFVGGQAMAQLWLFIVAPVLGGLAAGALFRNRVLED